MLAIYKELKSYLTSMVGFACLCFCVADRRYLHFQRTSFQLLYPKFEYTLNAMTFVFLIAVPILTMRVLAEKESPEKTDQLLLSSPVSVSGIVLGISCTCDYLCNPYCSSGNLSADHVKVRNRCIALRTQHSLDFPSQEVQTLRSAYFSQQSLSSNCSSSYLCIFICFLYDEWNFFLFFQRRQCPCVTFGILILALSLMITVYD